ncbi:hypothetical protein [Thermospira aquatica]|uniref:Outer membrane protein beta-barrel domain-containing protein n=1 Tax=Thermospira aquatica TaxID=2828656 RepID=A0AAX3BDT5_9SPIR|nr:hypothetical protein [Thermospira aquatica]URA10209.1 hypothetical protein KDW03_12135 [Thermospira aquatica]
MKKKILFGILFILATTGWTQTSTQNNLIAIDLGWTTEGFFNEGVGWGMLIDIELYPVFSARLRHGVVETSKTAVGKRVGNYVSSLLFVYRPWALHQKWFQGWFVATGFGYDQVITAEPTTGEVSDHFLLPFVDFSLGYRFTFGRIVIEPYVSILLPFVDPDRSKTGIAMYTHHVDLEGISLGITF